LSTGGDKLTLSPLFDGWLLEDTLQPPFLHVVPPMRPPLSGGPPVKAQRDPGPDEDAFDGGDSIAHAHASIRRARAGRCESHPQQLRRRATLTPYERDRLDGKLTQVVNIGS
jgi:hypothetical protein